MIALLVLFDLTHSSIGLDALRSGISESLERYRELDGLRQKVYLSAASDTFGGFYLFESEEALASALPRLGAATQQRTGVVPRILRFDVDAIVEGRHTTPDLTRAGRAPG
jgi:hypothetical protein